MDLNFNQSHFSIKTRGNIYMSGITGSPIEPAFVETFNSELQHAYSGEGILRDNVRLITNTGGSSFTCPVMTGGVAKTRGAAHSDLEAMGSGTKKVTIVYEDVDATEFIDDFEQFKVNFSIKEGYIEAISEAIGKKEDSIIIQAMVSGATKSVPTDVSGSATNLTVKAVKAACAKLDADEVKSKDRHFAFTSSQKEALLGSSEVTSSDYNNVKALVAGEVDTFMGFKFHMLGENRAEGLPIVTTTKTRSCFAWHKKAITYASASGVKSTMNYSASKGSTVVRGYFSAGAAVTLPEGVVKVLCVEG